MADETEEYMLAWSKELRGCDEELALDCELSVPFESFVRLAEVPGLAKTCGRSRDEVE